MTQPPKGCCLCGSTRWLLRVDQFNSEVCQRCADAVCQDPPQSRPRDYLIREDEDDGAP